MKNVFAVLFLLICLCANAQEKSLKFGFKTGLNLSSINNYLDDNDENRKTVLLGGFVEFPINEKFSFAPEIVYSSQGEVSNFETVDGNFEAITHLDYLNFPLIAKYYLVDSFALEAGPQIGFLLTDSRSLQSDGEFNGDFEQEFNNIFQNEFSTFDAGFNLGATYEFPFKFFVQARYYFGVLDINDTDSFNEKLRNNVLQFAVGYSI